MCLIWLHAVWGPPAQMHEPGIAEGGTAIVCDSASRSHAYEVKVCFQGVSSHSGAQGSFGGNPVKLVDVSVD